MRDGQVRCGHCKNVFDGNAAAHLARAPRPWPTSPSTTRPCYGPPTVTLRSSRALEPVPSVPAPEPMPPEPTAPERRRLWRSPSLRRRRAPGIVDGPACVEPPDEPGSRRAVAGARGRNARSTTRSALRVRAGRVSGVARQAGRARAAAAAARADRAGGVPLSRRAGRALAGDQAARWRGLRAAGLRDPPAARQRAALSIDASDLQADPAHRGLLILTATLRNRAGVAARLSPSGTHADRRAGSGRGAAGARARRVRRRHGRPRVPGLPANTEVAGQVVHRCQRDDAGGLSPVRVLPLTRRAPMHHVGAIGRVSEVSAMH